MATDSANGSTVNFGGTTVTKITSISYNGDSNAIDVTGLTNATHQYVSGIPNATITIECIGTPNTVLTVGTTGAVTVAWNSGHTDSVTAAIITGLSHSGGIDAPITSTLTIQPYASS